MQWISVKNELPEKQDSVLILTKHWRHPCKTELIFRCYMAFFIPEEHFFSDCGACGNRWNIDCSEFEEERVVCWMPCPPIPKEELDNVKKEKSDKLLWPLFYLKHTEEGQKIWKELCKTCSLS